MVDEAFCEFCELESILDDVERTDSFTSEFSHHRADDVMTPRPALRGVLNDFKTDSSVNSVCEETVTRD